MYHYQVCGLSNVWLENGYTEKDTRYGKATAVADADQLHQVLAMAVADKDGTLTGEEVRFLRKSMLCSQRSLGEMLGVEDQTISLWERDQTAIPKAHEAVLRMLATRHAKGQADVREVVQRRNAVDRLVNQKIVARAQDHRWAAETEPA